MGTSTLILIGAIVVGIILLSALITVMYIKAPPSYAFILSGIRKEPRILIGTGGFKIPFLERLDKVFLGQVTVDVKTSIPVPTLDFVPVSVDAVCKVRTTPTPEGTRLAAKNFLNKEASAIAQDIKDSLEGNMREVIGAIELKNLVTDRDKFSDEIQSKAAKDMAKLGLEVISCNIQNITDSDKLIESLGADNSFMIKKNAAITKANAERDIKIAEQRAKKEANDIRVETETEIAERDNELDIKKAELKKASDIKKAESDAAYEIQKQEQQKAINTKTVDAQIEQTKREQVLSQEKIKIKENELKAEVNAKADAAKYETTVKTDAEKYKKEIDAQAALEQKKREAEANAYLALKEAEATKAKAEAKRYEMEQEAEAVKAMGLAEAEATKARGLAEAESIKAKGNAEAEAMDKKAEAYSKYGQAAIVEILSKVMPEMAEAVAKPISAIDSVNIYGGDGSSSASKMSANVPMVIKQTIDTIKSVTGVDLGELAKSKALSLTSTETKGIPTTNKEEA